MCYERIVDSSILLFENVYFTKTNENVVVNKSSNILLSVIYLFQIYAATTQGSCIVP